MADSRKLTGHDGLYLKFRRNRPRRLRCTHARRRRSWLLRHQRDGSDRHQSSRKRRERWREIGLGAQILRDLKVSSITLIATPAEPVLGTDTSVVLELEAPADATELRVFASRGRVEQLTAPGPGGRRAVYFLPSERVPQWAVLIATASSRNKRPV